MTWLVTGGAGYIGSHVVRALLADGLSVVVLDDLSSGRSEFLPPRVELIRGSTLESEIVQRVLIDHSVVGVIHLAGFKYAGVSVERPLHTYHQNIEGTRVLLDAMSTVGVRMLVFSSSAAVYGAPSVELVTEETPTAPTSPYGRSKLVCEWLIRDQAVATARAGAGLAHTSLRYFNVVGSAHSTVSDVSPYNLFPRVFSTLRAGNVPTIYGVDYATPDGTNVRDYVHVGDVAQAHVTAARRLLGAHPLGPVYNLGAGRGHSVREIMTAVAEVTGIDFTPEIGPRRPGDPDRIVATGSLAREDLGWANRYSLQQMVRTAWEAASNERLDEASEPNTEFGGDA